jgi:hypothetical protein
MYAGGKLIAYKTLCRMAIKSAMSSNAAAPSLTTSTTTVTAQDSFDSVSEEFMDLFYMTVHHGLRSDDKATINCIIQTCGTRLWHCMLPSSTLLLKDFIDACLCIDAQGLCIIFLLTYLIYSILSSCVY